jgi:hypothetical protein
MTERLRPGARGCIVAIACALMLALPAAAPAVSCAPPGNSGVDQYFETIPGASCNQPGSGPGSGNGGHAGHGGGSLPAATKHQLTSEGAAGQAVQRLVAATAPAGAGSRSRGGRGKSHHRRGAPPSPGPTPASAPTGGSGRGVLGGILHPIITGASSGVGVVLPLFLGAVLAAITATTLLRRRRVGRQ